MAANSSYDIMVLYSDDSTHTPTLNHKEDFSFWLTRFVGNDSDGKCQIQILIDKMIAYSKNRQGM